MSTEQRKIRTTKQIIESGEDWRTTHKIPNKIAKKILAESEGRDNCDLQKVIAERLEDSYKRNPFKKRKAA